MTNYRERYLIKQKDRRMAEEWTGPAAERFGLIFYRAVTVIRVYTAEDFLDGVHLAVDPTLKPEVCLFFSFAPFDKESEYLRRIAFDSKGNSAEWQGREAPGEPPAGLSELLLNLPEEGKIPIERISAFSEIYAGIYSRLFPDMDHCDLHTDASSEEYDY